MDPAPDAPTVEKEERNPESLLNTVKALLSLRHREGDLQADAAYETVCAEKDKPFVYRRGEMLLAVNPAGEAATAKLPAQGMTPVFTLGDAKVNGESLLLGAQSFAVLK